MGSESRTVGKQWRGRERRHAQRRDCDGTECAPPAFIRILADMVEELMRDDETREEAAKKNGEGHD